jgi:hypothetical protein
MVFPLIGAGCITGSKSSLNGGDSNATVVERSKEQAPPWTADGFNVLRAGDQNFTYSYMRDRLLDLPLGLKQTQLTALESSEREFEGYMKERLVEIAHEQNVKIDTALDKLGREVAETARKFHEQNAIVQDLYFEQLEHSPPLENGAISQTFRVYVLIAIAKTNYPSLMDTISKRLISTKDSQLRRLGLILRQKQKQISSH